MPVAWAAGAAAVAGVAGTVYASEKSGEAADKSIAAQREGRDQARSDLMPWADAGQRAIPRVNALLGLDGPEAAATALEDFRTSPGYDFRFNQGVRALDASASARGMLRSGAQQKALTAFGQGSADQEFTAYYNRLMDLSRVGQSSAAGQASAAQTAGQGTGATTMANGNTQAGLITGAAQGIGNAINTYGNNRRYEQGMSNVGMIGGAGGMQTPPEYNPPTYGGGPY